MLSINIALALHSKREEKQDTQDGSFAVKKLMIVGLLPPLS